MTPLSSPPTPLGQSQTSLLVSFQNNIITHLAGYSFAAFGTKRRTPKLVSRAPLVDTGIWAVRGLLDSFLLRSHDQCPDTLSMGPCAGSQDTPARTGSDSLVPCTTPCTQLSRVLPYGVVVAIYVTAIDGSTRGERIQTGWNSSQCSLFPKSIANTR
jgi:hypothetical protein